MVMRRGCRLLVGVMVLVLGLAGSVYAQDSVSVMPCLPGDAVGPWDTAEQQNDYVVDLATFTASWGTTFGIAPVVKSSKSHPDYFGSLLSAQAISPDILKNQPVGGSYYYWAGPGGGVHNTENEQSQVIDMTGVAGNQFAMAVAEYATTGEGVSYNGIIGALVHQVPTDPMRLYVSRVLAATNGATANQNRASMGFGSCDASGNVYFRADDYGVDPGPSVSGDNIYRVSLADRTTNILNNIGHSGANDAAATEWLIRSQGQTHAVPCCIPESLMGQPWYIGTNFGNQFLRGPAYGSVVSSYNHLATGMGNTRGGLAYTTKNCAAVNSTRGVCGLIGLRSGDGLAKGLNIFGLNASGNVTGTRALNLPDVITDPFSGASPLEGEWQFDHYHSQVPYNGGNGQVALNTDASGNLLVAAVADHPEDVGPDWPVNFVPVARVDAQSGQVEWTLAGYNDGTIGPFGTGKAILDGPGGNVIGRMITLDNVTGGAPFGPSISSPMIDAGGNIWFVTAVETFEPSRFTTALVRGVYQEDPFGYELELVLKLGDVFFGENTQLEYMITFMGIADSNSISSGTAFSGNMIDEAHLGAPVTGLARGAAEGLGGMVLSVEVVYDVDEDGDFEQPCNVDSGDIDQDYNVLLYIGATTQGVECYGDEDCDDGLFCNGAEVCDDGACVPGIEPCMGYDHCDEAVDICYNCPIGDLDGDCDADLDDYAIFADCYALHGPGAALVPQCVDADVDEDGDVDLEDASAIQWSFTGYIQ